MKFYSEKTKKLYDTEKEAAAAEKEFDAAQERKLAAQKAEEWRDVVINTIICRDIILGNEKLAAKGCQNHSAKQTELFPILIK